MSQTQLHSPPARTLQDVDPSVHKVEVLKGPTAGIKIWMLHRIAGVGLLLYLLAHIGTMSTAMFLGDAAFKRTFDVLFHTAIFEIFDVLVLAGLVLHGLNGIRLIIMEMGVWVTKSKQKKLLIVTALIALALFVWLFVRAFV